MMLEAIFSFVVGMIVGAVGFTLVLAIIIGSDPRHWRK